MAINKVVYGNSTLIDLTEDTVSANNLLAGETAHDRSGASVVGSVVTAEVVDNLTTQDATKALSANQGYVLNQNKVDKVTGKGLSTNDYTNEEKTKLAGIGAGAEPNVQSDWKQSDSSSDDFIKNKPTSEIQTSDGQFTTVTGGLMQSCVVDLEPIQSGSGTPSPSNVRAISGHTSVDVWNYGENLLSGVENGAYDSTNGAKTVQPIRARSKEIFMLNAGTYTIKATTRVSGKTVNIAYQKWANGTYGSNTRTYDSGWLSANETFTFDSNSYASFVIRYSDNSNINAEDLFVILQKGTEINGYTVTVNLGGTYYGGTLDAVSGVLTVTHARVDLGSYTWGKTGANLFFTEYPRDFKKAVYASGFWYANGDCECYKFIQDSITSEDGVINLYFEEARSFYRMFVNDSSRYSLSASDFKTAVTGQYLVYELATPTTIQLTPTQLDTLVGQNDVFAPLVGQTVEEVEFREVMSIDDVVDAIPYENVAPDVGTGETYTYFRIHRYGRVVVFTFMQDSAIQIVEQATRKIFGVLPERFYTKISGAMPYNTIKYTFINQNRFGVFVPKLLEIDPTNGNVYADYEADEGICPMGSLTYILDHD